MAKKSPISNHKKPPQQSQPPSSPTTTKKPQKLSLKKFLARRHQNHFTNFLVIFSSILIIFVSFQAFEYFKSFEIEIKPKAEIIPPPVKTVEVIPPKVNDESVSMIEKPKRPKYWFYMARGYMWIFISVDNVLQRLGLEKINMEIKQGEHIHMDWDLLWSYDYHNEIPMDFKELKYHQKINHIPGNYALTMKDFFAVNTQYSKYIPRAFNDTAKLRAYAAENPEKKFLQKLWSNRGISMKKVEEMDFEVFGPGYKYFGQEYVEPPLLIDGHKFDFGVYVLISSINPLRIYIYDKNVLIRLCEQKYDPGNFTNDRTYVISDYCLFPWDMEVLSVYYNQSYTYKEALNAYLIKNGYKVEKIWKQVEECIRDVVVSKEDNFIHFTQAYPYKHSFFELFRFDFLLDEDLNLFLIEVNQSPNINPSNILYRDQRLFENLLYNVFTTIGVGHYMPKEDFRFGNVDVEAMIAHEESWTVLPETCVTSPCNTTCEDHELCGLCKQCMTNNQRHELHLAYREAKNRGAMKRIFPPPKSTFDELGEEYLNTLNPENKWQTRWYLEMCKKDSDFC